MPTRYTLDVDFKASVSADVLDNSTKKVEVQKVSRHSACEGTGSLQDNNHGDVRIQAFRGLLVF